MSTLFYVNTPVVVRSAIRRLAADVERELNDLLDAGIDEICAFEMTAIVDDPELYAVFLKYCGKD